MPRARVTTPETPNADVVGALVADHLQRQPGAGGAFDAGCRRGSPGRARAWSGNPPVAGPKPTQTMSTSIALGRFASGLVAGHSRVVQRLGDHDLGQRLGGAVLGQARRRSGSRPACTRSAANWSQAGEADARAGLGGMRAVGVRSRRCSRAQAGDAGDQAFQRVQVVGLVAAARSLRCPRRDGGCSRRPVRRRCGRLRRRRAPPARGRGR